MDRSHEQSRDVTLLKMAILVTFLIAVNKIPNESNLWKGGFVLAHSSGAVYPGREVVEDGA